MSDQVGNQNVGFLMARLIYWTTKPTRFLNLYAFNSVVVLNVTAHARQSNLDREITYLNQRTNGPVNAHLISGPSNSPKHTKPGKQGPEMTLTFNALSFT